MTFGKLIAGNLTRGLDLGQVTSASWGADVRARTPLIWARTPVQVFHGVDATTTLPGAAGVAAGSGDRPGAGAGLRSSGYPGSRRASPPASVPPYQEPEQERTRWWEEDKEAKGEAVV